MNLCNLTKQERESIEIKRVASLLIHNLKRQAITRADIEKQISATAPEKQGEFKDALNFYNKK